RPATTVPNRNGRRTTEERRKPYSVAGPDPGQPLEAFETAPVGASLHRPEHRALKGRGWNYLFPAPIGLGGLRRFVLIGDSGPQALEQCSGGQAAEDACEQAERTVEQFDHGHPCF